MGVDIWIEIMNKTEKNAVFILFFFRKKVYPKREDIYGGRLFKIKLC